MDSGSSVSLLPWTNHRDVGKLRPYNGRVMSVCGMALDIVGERRVQLNFEGFSVEHDFLFCRGLSQGLNAIIGVDFLKLNAVVVDLAHGDLCFPAGKVSLGGDIFASIQPDSFNMSSVLYEFSDILRSEEEAIGETTLIEHDIELDDDHPVRVRPRPIPFHLRATVAEQLSKMLSLGIVQESSSPWSSPILMVPKANGKYRFCVDFRRLNEKTKKDGTPVPRIDEVLAEVGRAKIFSTLDLLSGFWQVPLTKRAQSYTAFSVGNRHYEFTKMAFGLTGAPLTFARLMRKVLAGVENVAVYGDDIIIFSDTQDDHMKHVRQVLQRVKQAGLVLKAEKCHFGKEEVNFLGHKISAGKVMPLPEKVESVRRFARPSSKKQLMSFIGLAGFYRRFVPNFSSIVAPLYDLTKGGASWRWGDREEKAFEEIKSKLCESPVVLQLPDVRSTFEVSTDASEVGLGAVLSQNGQVVEYASRILNAAERNYSTTDRELLAVVWAVEKWRQYLYAQPFTVLTDHRPITYLNSVKEPKGRMARWLARLQEYNVRLQYQRGADNHVADCLSRLPMRPEGGLQDHEVLPPAMDMVSALLFYEDPRVLGKEQREDPELRAVIEAKEFGTDVVPQGTVFKRYRQIWPQLLLSNDKVLMRSLRHHNVRICVPVIPADQRRQLLEECHGSAHMGVERTHDLIKSNAYWPGLLTDVQKFVASCKRCQLYKPVTNRNKAPMRPIVTSRPMEVWAMDIVGPLPCTASDARYILVATDLFSKWVEAAPLSNQTAASVAQAFVQKVVLRHGPPKSLLTDQGSNFESLLMKEVCQLLGIRKIRTSPFHPRSDGQTERANRTVKEWLASMGGDWEKQLPFAVFAINATASAATKVSPFEVVYGRRPPLLGHSRSDPRYSSLSSYVADLRRNLRLFRRAAEVSAKEDKQRFTQRYNVLNKSEGWTPYKVGSQVKYRDHYPDRDNRKFSARFRGPFVIKSRRGVNYEISDAKARPRWVHHDEIFPWSSDNDPPMLARGRDHGEAERSLQGFSSSSRDQALIEEDSSSENTVSESSDSSDEESAEEGNNTALRRSSRCRRPPCWLRDFYV